MGTKFDDYVISSCDKEDLIDDILLGYSSFTDTIYLEQGSNHISLKEYQLIEIVETLIKKGAINVPLFNLD